MIRGYDDGTRKRKCRKDAGSRLMKVQEIVMV